MFFLRVPSTERGSQMLRVTLLKIFNFNFCFGYKYLINKSWALDNLVSVYNRVNLSVLLNTFCQTHGSRGGKGKKRGTFSLESDSQEGTEDRGKGLRTDQGKTPEDTFGLDCIYLVKKKDSLIFKRLPSLQKNSLRKFIPFLYRMICCLTIHKRCKSTMISVYNSFHLLTFLHGDYTENQLTEIFYQELLKNPTYPSLKIMIFILIIVMIMITNKKFICDQISITQKVIKV